MREDPPIRSWKQYERQHTAYHNRLWAYICKANGMKRYSPELIEEIKVACPTSLFSTNLEVRLTFMRCAYEAFLTGEIQAPNGFFKLTLALREHTTSLQRAHEFDCEPLKSWAAKLLIGRNHFGMIDAALYTKTTTLERYRRPLVSWHSHQIVWGSKEAELRRIVEHVNKAHQSLVRGLPPADLGKPMNLPELLRDLFYDLKAPLKEYRVWHWVQGQLKQKKRPLRVGLALGLSNAFVGRTIPSLMITGGEGVRLLETVLSNTRSELEARERQHLRELHQKMTGRQVVRG